MTTWRPPRRLRALLAIMVATLTVGIGAVLRESDGQLCFGLAYVALTTFALFYPPAILAQVIGGQAFAGTFLLASGKPPLPPIVVMVAAVVATAELLTSVARMDTPIKANTRGDFRRVVLTATAGGGLFAVATQVGGVPGLHGLLAVSLASAVCILLAGVLAAHGQRPGT